MKTFIELSQDEIADLITAVSQRAELLSRLLDDDHTVIAKEVDRLDNLIEKLNNHVIVINHIDCEEKNDD